MAKAPFSPFAKKAAPAKSGAKSGKPAGKLCPGCKNPTCKRAGKCAK